MAFTFTKFARDHYSAAAVTVATKCRKEMSEDYFNLENDEWPTKPKRCRVDRSTTDSADNASLTTEESTFEYDGNVSDCDIMSTAESTGSEAFFSIRRYF